MEDTQTLVPAPAEPPGAISPAYPLGAEEFAYLRRLIYDSSGIHLKDAKRQMVQSRLTKRLRLLGLPGFDAYVAYVRKHPEELTDLINRITTNKTHFFREPVHFRFLQNHLLPELVSRAPGGRGEVRGWCAASSTGEEPYTIGTILARFLGECRGWSARLLASDLDTSVLARARRGVYPQATLSGIPRALARAYTVAEPDGEAGTFGFTPEVTGLIQFRQINLMAGRYPIRAPLDFIFCRNVFIYFTHADRDGVVERFIDLLKPGGYLFLGHSEVLDPERFGGRLRFAGSTTYQRAGR